MKCKSAGFSLIEILFAMMIIGVLVVVMLPGFKSAMNRVNRFVTERTMEKVEFGLTQYNMEVGSYPGRREGGLNALVIRPQNVDPADWKGPYLEAIKLDEDGNAMIKDKWGRQLEYNCPPAMFTDKYRQYELISHGANEDDQNGYIVRGR